MNRQPAGELLKVTVEQEHIDAGQKGNPFACPVALALRAFGADVFNDMVWIGERRYLPEPALQQFIHDFDAGLPVQPRDYRLKALPKKATP